MMEPIRGSTGQIEYYLDNQGSRIVVRNIDGSVVGWTQNGNTYNNYGQLVSYSENIAALIR